MNSRALTKVTASALPALSGSQLTYNAEKNIYLTLGHTSNAGNTYFKAIRFSNRLAVFYDIGVGYAHTFLNGITLFCWDGKKAKIIAKRDWGGYNWHCFSERFAKEQSILMLTDYIQSTAKALGEHVNEQGILAYSRQMIEETNQKQLA